MGKVRGRVAFVALSVLSGMLLTACAVPPFDADAPIPTASPEPTPNVAEVNGPVPRVPSACVELLPIGTVRAALTDDVDPVPSLGKARSPLDAALEQQGGMTCVWANGTPKPAWETPDPEYAEARLQIMPDAQEGWERYAAVYGPTAEPSPYGENAIGPYCTGLEPELESPSPSHDCYFDAYIGSYWVQLRLLGVAGNAATSEDEALSFARKLLDPLVDTLKDQPHPSPVWTPPASDPMDCASLLSDEQAASLTGVPDLFVGRHWDGPMVGQFAYALDVTAADRCAMGFRDSDNEIGDIAYLPGGGWAVRERSQEWVDSGDAVAITLPGAREGEKFTEQCARVDADCLVDLLVGESWIQVRIPAWVPGKMSYPEGVDMQHVRSQGRAIAETILANLHSRG